MQADKGNWVLFSHSLLPTPQRTPAGSIPPSHMLNQNYLTFKCLTQSLQQKSSCCFLMCCSRSAKVLNGFTSGHKEHLCCSSFLRDNRDFLEMIQFPLNNPIPVSKPKCCLSGRRCVFTAPQQSVMRLVACLFQEYSLTQQEQNTTKLHRGLSSKRRAEWSQGK